MSYTAFQVVISVRTDGLSRRLGFRGSLSVRALAQVCLINIDGLSDNILSALVKLIPKAQLYTMSSNLTIFYFFYFFHSIHQACAKSKKVAVEAQF